MTSLQTRLGSGLFFSLLVTFFAIWLLASNAIQYLSEGYIQSRLEHDIDTLLSAIEFNKKDSAKLNPARINTVYNRPFSGHYYQIKISRQLIRSRSLWDQQLESSSLEAGQTSSKHSNGPQNQTLLMVSQAYDKKEHLVIISIAEDLTPIQQQIQHFKRKFAIGAALLLLILLSLQAWILKTGLRPFVQIRNDLRELEQGKQTKLDRDVPKELSPLVSEINHLLSVMEHRLQRSRHALTDLAHALKKPLTVIKQITQQDQQLPSEITQNLNTQINSIQGITNNILKRAQLAGQGPSAAQFSFQQDLPALLKTLEVMYRDKKLEINCPIPDDTHYPMDREDMLELLGNLLDNACKWAKSQVTVSVIQNDRFNISIEDDGPGVDKDLLTSLPVRGLRLDEQTEGHGFGLAIAREITENYQGQIAFERSERLGGFMVHITLPVTTMTKNRT